MPNIPTESEPRYLVVVDAEYESEWDLTPMSFSTHDTALRHAAGIARGWGWDSRSHAPTISIKGPEGTHHLSVDSLLVLGHSCTWFD